MKLALICSYKDSPKDTWEEIYDENITDPKKWGHDIVDNFNATLRPNEKLRLFHSVRIIDKNSIAKHDWDKTNLVTIIKNKQLYDTYKCKSCGITAKRFGVGEIIIDNEFKAKVYQRCDTANIHLEKKRIKEEQP